ncbi:MAG: type II CRISPR RNA-guided endonuclease Cas9 [Gammaproteobacteria bacterium RIFOXYA12_FULL_61_12]|nr:CRISPR-associated protein Cas9 [uncultured bacterium]OGT89034.1 MAG: type II CRISPR RNA-guided endonuclease Cas9 [Gammaproteobacteria bacterium RIFOXYD12_FULL_61_37]OGT94183.1 MAG: type II CRISPR RNA-guided endonuclease Cas9 [Gammaproteobacteria bacterium RIFOXYA12_FULL_61_12]
MKNRNVIGIDVGTNSIGWALVEENENGLPQSLKAAGVRIFQEAVEAKTRTPKNHKRRQARLARRVLARRARRKQRLQNLLLKHGLLPGGVTDPVQREAAFTTLGDPYQLRAKGLNLPLGLHEFGRVLFQLGARRGFLSNRKTRYGHLNKLDELADLIEAEDAAPKTGDAEEGIIRKEIGELRQAMSAAGSRTLGEYLAGLAKEERKRCRHTERAMLEEEFERLWMVQARFHPELSDELKVQVHTVIFFQRPLKSNRASLGKCSLEPSRRKAARAWPEAQRFRLLQDLNNLEILDPRTGELRRLRDTERAILLNALEQQKSMTWNAVRKKLGLHQGEKFNLETGAKAETGLKGLQTLASLHAILQGWFDELGDKRDLLIEDLITIEDSAGLYRRLREHWGFDRETAFRLATLELEPGYASLSLKAIRKLLPHMGAGHRYSEARQQVGYGYETGQRDLQERLGEPPDPRNPVVDKALHELRRVINALIHRFGRPDVVRVELARDLKLAKRDKERLEKQNRENQRLNRKAEAALAELGLGQPSRDDLIKYRLWEESKGLCPYTGREIGLSTLFSPEVDVEHIIPYSRCLDDSYMNKTLCMTEENRMQKGNRTPWEAYGGDPARYEQILQCARYFPMAKRKRFLEQGSDFVDQFIQRQLNDTRYIAKLAKEYLAAVCTNVQVTKGGTTAMLRHHWGLNRLLGEDDGQKERGDHRHHALDAAVIAVTSRSLYQRLARIAHQRGHAPSQRGFYIDPPWQGYQADLAQTLAGIVVSHATNRKLTGALHEETAYGHIPHVGFVYRKTLNKDFKLGDIEAIYDPSLQELVKAHLEHHGNDPKRAFAEGIQCYHKDGHTPIKRVRIRAKQVSEKGTFSISDRAGRAYKHHKTGSNHHVEILRHRATGKIEPVYLTTKEATERARRGGEPVIQRDHGPEWEFIISLCINDMVRLGEGGQVAYFRVQKIEATNNRVTLRSHLAATLDDEDMKVTTSVPKLAVMPGFQKVLVTAVGEVLELHD